MNYYLTILLIVLSLLALLDVAFPKQKKLGEQLFHIAFFFSFCWVGIKYYLGPDIFSYVPFYENVPSPALVLQGKGYTTHNFEIGYVLFCSVLKHVGISFWGMTFIITTIYFYAIYTLFKQIPHQKTLALYALCLLDYNLILYEYRQCLAVSFFIFSYFAYKNRRYVWLLVFSIIAISMHKSAIFIYFASLALIPFWHLRIDKRVYILLCFLFLTLLFIPLKPILLTLAAQLPLSQAAYSSIALHLKWGNTIQLIFPIYLLLIVNLAYYTQFNDKQNQKWHWFMWCCIAVIVFLYQYWFFLNRLRSYFLPFLLIYVFKTLVFSNKKDIWLRQLFVLVFFAYGAYFLIGNYIQSKKLVSKTNNISTVLERIRNSEEELKKRQMAEAKKYWLYDFKKVGH